MSNKIQLGFAEPYQDDDELLSNTFVNLKWRDWDGGKAGGKPIWLDPNSIHNLIQNDVPFRCSKSSNCDSLLHFVCQLYCPATAAENQNDNDAAFHRAIYVFLCPNVTCRNARVLRCQLPRKNKFYSYNDNDEDEEEVDQKPKLNSDFHGTNSNAFHFCEVCNQPASKKCPKQELYFCCRDHQVEHYACVKNGRLSLCVYNEVEIVVEEEPEEVKEDDDKIDKNQNEIFKHLDDTEEDVDLEQDDLNIMTGARGIGEEDSVTAEFYQRINRNNGSIRDQCLRYNSGWQSSSADKMLFTSSVDIPSSGCIDPPPCENCGGKRQFEFQILPQLLHLIGVDSKNPSGVSDDTKQAILAANTVIEESSNKESEGNTVHKHTKSKQKELIDKAKGTTINDNNGVINFGTIAVYSCVNSCNVEGTQYSDEYAWVQQAI